VALDISGYFVGATSTTGFSFYPLPPCRVFDTRAPGGQALAGGETRTVSIANLTCLVPPLATAYSLNITAIPRTTLAYLSAWPSDQPRPQTSVLNAPTGAITANAAIVPGAAVTGSVDVFASNDTDLVIDINGYFASPGLTGSLAFYTVPPCRVYDNRIYDNAATHGDPVPALTGERDIPVSAKCAMDVTATAFSVNVTAIPKQPTPWLTMWRAGATMPGTSVLNAADGAVTSNAALVGVSPLGALSLYTPGTAEILLDVNGVFIPETVH